MPSSCGRSRSSTRRPSTPSGQWVYEPMVIDGKAVPVVFTVTVRFTLK